MALVGLVRRHLPSGTRLKAGLVFIGLAGVALFYGDGMITPAISVLSAVEGVKVAAPSLELDRAAARPRRPHDAVRDPAVRDARGRPAVRPGDDRLVPHARGRGRKPPRPPPADHSRDLAEVRGGLLREPPVDRVHLARLGRADGDRRRGALRGHGPFRTAPDQPRLVLRRLPGADDQLHGPGIADPLRPGDDLESVLPAAARVGAGADGLPRDDRDADRVAGGDLRGVLRDPPGDSARLPPAADRPAHVGRCDRAGLRPRRQLGPLRGGRRAGDRVRLVGEARHGVRDRGDRNAAHRLRALPVRGAAPVAQAALDDRRRDPRVRDRRPAVPRRQRHEDPPRRLVPAARRRSRARGHDDLGPRARQTSRRRA